MNYCKKIIYLPTLTDLFVLSFELNKAKVCSLLVINELRVRSNQIYSYISRVCVFTCNLLGVHKFRANILTTCKGHHDRTLWFIFSKFSSNNKLAISFLIFF